MKNSRVETYKNSSRKSETKIQQEIFIWHWNNYPEERGLLFAVHNNAHNKTKGAINKSIGVVSGVSDMIYLNPRTCQSQFLEVKTDKGRQSKEQQFWEKQIDKNGFNYYLIRSLEDFKEVTGLK